MSNSVNSVSLNTNLQNNNFPNSVSFDTNLTNSNAPFSNPNSNNNSPTNSNPLPSNPNSNNNSPVRLQLQPANPNPPRFFICNTLGNKDYNCEMNFAKEQEVAQAYEDLEGMVYRLLQLNSTTNRNMVFNLSQKSVSYTDGTGRVVTRQLDLIGPNDLEFQQKRRILEDVVMGVWGGKLVTEYYEPGFRTCSPGSGVAPFSRSTETLQKLPNSYTESAKFAMKLIDPTQQDQALKRIAAAEKMICSMTKKFDLKISELQATITPQNSQLIQSQIEELVKKKKQLKIDRTALYIALSFFPANQNPSITDVMAAITRMQTKLQEEIESQRTILQQIKEKGRTIWEKMTGVHITLPDDKQYAADAAALLFSILSNEDARGPYLQFIQNQTLITKADSFEDLLVRFVFNGCRANSLIEMDTLVAGISDQIPGTGTNNPSSFKVECQQELVGAYVQSTALLTMSNPYPQNSTTIDQKIDYLKTQYQLE